MPDFALRPIPVPPGDAGPAARPLAGGGLVFDRVEAVAGRGAGAERAVLALPELAPWAAARGLADRAAARLAALTAPRAPLAGLALDRPRLMGIVNVTPDSFSDGGEAFDAGRAVDRGLAQRAAGADILDVGGESTRPGAEPVPVEEELRRVLPVVRGLAAAGAVVSIDTRRARVMAAALDAGAAIVNDVTALAGDPDSLPLVARAGAPAVLMHMQGDPRSMQRAPHYEDAPLDVHDVLAARIAACAEAGIGPDRLVVDPGIGFGKTVTHNLQILHRVAVCHGLGCAVLVGASRKRFIGALSRNEPPGERVPGSVAAALAALDRGVQILRVHDVAETAQAIALWQAVTSPDSSIHRL